MSDKAIEVKGISKKYELGLIGGGTLMETLGKRMKRNGSSKSQEEKEFWALKDISFSVKKGEVIGIIGKNGAGKSTLLKVISRITQPTSGEIQINGRVASLLEVGTGFHPELTGRENIFLNGSILGMTRKEIKSKFDEIVDFSGIEKFIDTPVKRYSSGMYVRLAFAVAAHLEPEILVIDEVLAVGDWEFQKKCLGKMKEVSEGKGRTVLFVSHNMNSVHKLCDRGILLKEGGIILNSSISNIVSAYLNENSQNASQKPTIIFEQNSNAVAEFRYIELVSELSGLPATTFDISESFFLSIGIRISKKLSSNFKLGFTVENSQEDKILLSYIDDHPESVVPNNPGNYDFKIVIPLPLLKPDEYFLTIGMVDSTYELSQVVKKCIRFSIQNISLKKQNKESLIYQNFKWITHKKTTI